jgi:hypothetical protein
MQADANKFLLQIWQVLKSKYGFIFQKVWHEQHLGETILQKLKVICEQCAKFQKQLQNYISQQETLLIVNYSLR